MAAAKAFVINVIGNLAALALLPLLLLAWFVRVRALEARARPHATQTAGNASQALPQQQP